MSIKKLGNGKHFIRVKVLVNNKSKELKHTGNFSTIGAARAKEKQLFEALLHLKHKLENEELRFTWDKAVKNYLEESENNLRLSTLYNRKVMLEAHTNTLNDIEIKDLNKTDFKNLFEKINISTTTKNELVKYCRQVLDQALENRKIFFNPLKGVNFKSDKNEKRKTSTEAMTHEEIVQVLNFIQEVNIEFYEILFLTYQLGMRSGEAIALRFSDIDWDKNTVTIKRAWCRRKKGFDLTKTGQQRVVPINVSTETFLKILKIKYDGQEFILPRNKLWINGRMAESLREIQTHLGIRKTDYHSLRASFITNLLKNGVATVSVQSMVGHVELKTTQRYIRLHGTDLKGVTDVININLETET
ncbi:MAG: site-specific integrase [Bacteriovorax sp.]|jgi:integrase